MEAIAEKSTPRARPACTLTALLALVGFGYSAYLTYLELDVIDAIYQWCVGSAVVMTAVAVVAVVRMLRAP